MEEKENIISSEVLRGVMDQLHDEIMIYDNNYRLVYVNQASLRHYGIPAEKLIGKQFDELDQVYWGNSTLPLVYKTKQMVTKRQITNLGQDILTISVPIFDDKGNIQYVAQNVNDIYYINQISKTEEASVLVMKDKSEKEAFLYKSEKMKDILSMAEKLKNIQAPMLILGETGTGKSFLAQHIHNCCNRSKKPFVVLNCACMNPNLIESELFGYKRGAFSGASASGKKGIVEIADGGTLFLDEISEIPYELQSKLLLFLQSQEFIPIGGEKKQKVDVRIIAATNRSLKQMVQAGSFREDLYFRLNTFEITIPPLRERKSDIIILLQYYLQHFNHIHGQGHRFDEEALKILEYYAWPGNVRELSHVMEKLVVLSKEEAIHISDLPKDLFQITSEQRTLDIHRGLNDVLEEVEREMVLAAYKKYQTSVKVAKVLGISQPKAYRLIQKYIDV
ncbi:MAG: sigma 54-interacting transcriptional regulator [Anaerotignum sp.]|nr:sigma 54-interacting transcriptional regulator [Anaerotignum sp.]